MTLTRLKMTLAGIVLFFSLSPFAWAELSINSVYPNVGKIGEDLSVAIRGIGFGSDTRVSMSVDARNRSQIIGSIDTPGFACGSKVVKDTLYMADGPDGLQIMDVSDPKNPAIIGSVDTPEYAVGIFVIDQIAYVADNEGGLQIIDVSDSKNPAIIGSVDTPGYARDVVVIDQIAYVADADADLQVIDVSDPKNPAIIRSVATPGWAFGVFVKKETIYVADLFEGLQVIDVSDPQNPAIIGSVNTGHANEVFVIDQTAYVADGKIGFQVIDVSDPQNPAIIGAVDTPGCAYGVFVIDRTAYVADDCFGLQVIDVSEPENPAILGAVVTPGSAHGVFAIDQTTYVADGGSGLQVIDVGKPQNPAVIGLLNTPGYAYEVAVTGQIAYVADYDAGLEIIDVEDPKNPVLFETMNTPDKAQGLFVIDQTAYVADCDAGLQVIDVSDPYAPPILIGSIDTPGEAKKVFVIDQIAYVADYDAGLQAIDVSDPHNPAIIGFVDTPGGAYGVFVIDQTAYVADYDAGLQIIDVSDPHNPRIIGSVERLGYTYGVSVADQTAYVIGTIGLQVVDVSDPQNPAIVGSVDTPGWGYEVKVIGQTAYVADYFDGIQVIDVSDPQNPTIIGSVDTGQQAVSLAVSGNAVYVARCYGGLIIVPVPREIAPVQVIGPEEIRVVLPDPTIAGHYNLRVFNQEQDNELVGAVTFLSEEDYQKQLQKKAIVAAGGTGDPSDRLVVPTRNCANYAYRTLLAQGYASENIQFLAPHTDWDVDGDGLLNDVDDVCTSATLSSAIVGWGADSSELLVFLVDHGGVGTFYANADDIVRGSDLDYWMDVAQWTIPGKAVLIYDACYSGSFLADMVPPAGKERIVVAGSLATEQAWFMNDGALSFGYQFWASVFLNANLYESFVVAKNMMAHDQTAVLDANGDGEQTKEDVELVRDFVIGRGRTAASTPPLIGEVSEEQVLSETSGANLWASDIVALNEIERVWAVIVPPDFDNAGGEEITALDTVELADPDVDGVYVGVYDRFVQPGTYDVFVYASDVFQAFSLPKATTVVVVDPEEEGVVYVHPSGDCGVGREPCYDTVQQGLAETGRNAFRIEIAQGDYGEDLTVSNDCHYTLSGGYDSGYEGQSGLSAIIGSLTIVSGTVEIENLAIAGLQLPCNPDSIDSVRKRCEKYR